LASVTGVLPRSLSVTKIRALGVLALAVLAVLLPAVGPHRFLLANILCAVFVPATLLLERFVPPDRREIGHTAIDTIGLVTLIHLVPSAWYAAVALTAGTLAAGSFSMTAKLRLGFSAFAIFGLGIAANVHHVPNWQLPLLAVGSVLSSTGYAADFAQKLHAAAANRIAMLVDSADAMLWEIDLTTLTILNVHGRCREVTGYESDELISSFSDIIHPDDIGQIPGVQRDGDTFEVTIRIKSKDGSWRHLRNLGRTKFESGRSLAHGMTFDVTELEESKRALQHQAQTDSLTGLRNRVGLSAFLDQRLGDEAIKIGFLLLDLDGFKDVNDTLGHAAGDRLIALFGQRLIELRNEFDPNYTEVVRLGGDEFGFILIDDPAKKHPLEYSTEIFARIVRERLSEPALIDGQMLSMSASIGVAFGQGRVAAPNLMRDADIAMYEAKRARTGVEVFSAAPSGLTADRLELQADLNRALESEIVLWYQPVVNAQTGLTVSVEGLARWQHPVRGLLSPAVFLDMVDAARLGDRFDRHVLRLAITQAAVLALLPTPIAVAVNLSARSIWSPSLMSYLAEVVELHQLRPGSLTVEISERDLLDDHAKILPVLHKLRDLGIGLALDDYGTGYSSLIRLRELPLSELKIDRSFVAAIATNDIDRAIVRSSVDLARSIGMITVAEGVETADVLDLLKEWDCDRIQGYLFAKPMPANELSQFLSASVE
jgi:diguanylate cyclase (GGDEF)-like protein/PAS domain S-box-containing protein